MSATAGVARALAALALAVAAGCGKHQPQRRAVVQPRLPARVASELAVESTTVAQLLDARNSYAALRSAHVLQQRTIEAVNSGRVPSAFQEPLQSAVNDLIARIHCIPPAVPAPKAHGKEKGRHKHEHQGDQGD